MPTISDTLEIIINGNARGLIRATAEADSAVGRLQQRIESFREISAQTGELAHRGFEVLSDVIRSAGDEQVSLTRAVGNFKGAISGEELENWAKQLERITGIPHGRIEELAGELAAFGANPEQAEKLVGPILNVEQALKNTGQSAEGMGRQVAIALRTGNVGRLQRVLALDPRTQEQFKAAGEGAEGYRRRLEILLPVLEKMGGTAATDFQKTLPGAAMALRTSLETLAGAIGAPAIKPLTDLARAATDLTYRIEALPGPARTAIAVVGGGFVAALGLASLAAKGAALWNSLLLKQLLDTAKGHVDSGGAATAQAGEEGALAKVLGVTTGATDLLATSTGLLAKAHWAAAEAAGAQAAATRGIGIGGGVGGAARTAEQVAAQEARDAQIAAGAVGVGAVGAAAAAKAVGGTAGKVAAAEFDMNVGRVAGGAAGKGLLGKVLGGGAGKFLGLGLGELLGAALMPKVDPGYASGRSPLMQWLKRAGLAGTKAGDLGSAGVGGGVPGTVQTAAGAGITPGEQAIIDELKTHTQMWKEGRGSVSTGQVPLIRQLAARRVEQFTK